MRTKTVLITGASRGIGAAIATRFAQEGYQLILNCAHTKEDLYQLSDKLKEAYHAQILCCIGDIGDHHFVASMFDEIQKTFGKLDILVNNAGISHIGLLSDMDVASWNQIVSTNLTSVFLCSKAAIPLMLSQKSGKIINISSVWGISGASCEVAYSATKGGVNSFTKALAKELAPSNIQVNAIACGVIDTQMNACFDKAEKDALTEEIPAGRFGTPKEIAEATLQLSSSVSYLTGQIITIDGGFL